MFSLIDTDVNSKRLEAELTLRWSSIRTHYFFFHIVRTTLYVPKANISPSYLMPTTSAEMVCTIDGNARKSRTTIVFTLHWQNFLPQAPKLEWIFALRWKRKRVRVSTRIGCEHLWDSINQPYIRQCVQKGWGDAWAWNGMRTRVSCDLLMCHSLLHNCCRNGRGA